MKIIIDAQLSPHLAKWISEVFKIESYSVAFLGMLNAIDTVIFDYARKENAIVMTKDEDFIKIQHRLGSPPKIIWITCGNTTNQNIRKILEDKLPEALELIIKHDLVEIAD